MEDRGSDDHRLYHTGGEVTVPDSQPCPRCGFFQPLTAGSCLKCGIVFAKYRPPGDIPVDSQDSEPGAVGEEPQGPAGDHPLAAAPLDGKAWLSIGGGALLALAVLSMPRMDFIFQTFITLIHEMGHAIFGWLFGYPSLPAFDFMYGGGVTLHQERSLPVVVMVYALLAAGMVVYRRNRLTVTVIAALAILYSAIAFTRVHEAVTLFMGHGTELVVAGIFLYRGLSGFAVIRPVERPLYAFLGFFVVFSDMRFAWRLYSDPIERYLYGEAKGGGHWMDFSRLAAESLHVGLPAVAFLFFLCCFLPLIAVAVYRHRRMPTLLLLNRLFDRDPS